MAALARPLSRGIRLVRGSIVADERIFDSRRLGRAGRRTTATASPLSGLANEPKSAGNGRSAYVSSPPVAAAQRLKARSAASACPTSGR